LNESISLFIILPLSPVPLTEDISIPFSLAKLLANGDISILSLGLLLFETGFGSSLTSGFGSSLTSSFGSSLTSSFGSSLTSGFGSSLTFISVFLRS
jgi:hypothetical protein